jgi:hypothetical protein
MEEGFWILFLGEIPLGCVGGEERRGRGERGEKEEELREVS